MPVRWPEILKGDNDLLVTREGDRLIDLSTASGTTWLGHCNPHVSAAVTEQLQRVWITGGLTTAVYTEAKALIATFFSSTHTVAELYSTGMEAAEFAMRVARWTTRRNEIIGFEKSMHGKSMATAHLGWNNHDDLNVPCIHRLPFIGDCSEEQVLTQLEEALKRQTVSAVFVEPLQATGGGHMASPRFYASVMRLCRQYGTLTVFDEILTGFYRTGTPFLLSAADDFPDIVLIGKAIGNGFPVSGVVVRRDIPITPPMLPGSTFSGNPLAAAAVVATLKQFRQLDLPAMVTAIELTICATLGDMSSHGISLRGKGAIWILQLPEPMDPLSIVTRIYKRGALVNFTGRLIRLLPAATINLENLAIGCHIVRDELLRDVNG